MAMALPMIAAMFLNMMYNLVDSLWIGNLLGETAYAALTNSTPIILILTSVAMGATNGVSILISQAIGAKDKKKTESLIATSFSVAVAFSLLVTILLEAFLPGILKALNTPAETYDMAYSYLAIYILGYLAVYLYLYFTAVLRSFGNSMFQAVAMLVSTILNAILDPIFIHFIGFHGAAIATLLSQVICLLFMLIYLKKKKLFAFKISAFDKGEVCSYSRMGRIFSPCFGMLPGCSMYKCLDTFGGIRAFCFCDCHSISFGKFLCSSKRLRICTSTVPVTSPSRLPRISPIQKYHSFCGRSRWTSPVCSPSIP